MAASWARVMGRAYQSGTLKFNAIPAPRKSPAVAPLRGGGCFKLYRFSPGNSKSIFN